MSLLRMLLLVGAIGFVLGPASATPPPPARPVSSQTTPAPAVQNSVASLRKQGYRPAILLAGDLFLLVVGLTIVIAGIRQRPREVNRR